MLSCAKQNELANSSFTVHVVKDTIKNPFLVDVLKNGCSVSLSIARDIAVVKLALLDFQEDEGLKQKFSSHNLPCS
ncbi:hypothetical protein TNCV_3137261 [Trichonephila clavipes]|nr:hypothetical protein TNCV_3137261 [Trichonephila clavipes]